MMNIREMNATFGTLENRQLKLAPGLNILEGPNESGKSTWCAFIRAMLYGIPSSERDTKTSLAVKNKYKPWCGAPMSGTMRLDDGTGRELTLERKGSAASPMRDLIAYDRAGDRIKFADGAAGEALLGIGQETFERSAFIDHPELPSGSGDELERRILSLVSSGDETTSYTEAESRLKEWQRKLRFNKRGEMADLEDRIWKLRAASESVKKRADELANKTIQLRALEAEHDFLLREIEAHKAVDRAAALDRLAVAEARLAEAERDLAETMRMLPPGNSSTDEIRRLEREISAESERHRFIEAQTSLIAEKHRQVDQAEQQFRSFKPFFGSSAEQAEALFQEEKIKLDRISVKNETGNVLKKLIFLLFIPIVISVVFFFILPLYYAIPASVLFFAACAIIVIRCAKAIASKQVNKKQQALFKQFDIHDITEMEQSLVAYKKLDYTIRQLKSEEATLQQKLDSIPHLSETLIARIYEIFPSFKTIADIQYGIQNAAAIAISAIDKHSRALMLKVSAQSVIDALRSGTESSTATGSVQKPTIDKTEAAARMRQNEMLLSTLRRETALIEGSLEKEKLPDALDAEAAILTERLESLGRGYDAISLALDTLGEANKLLRERFSPALNAAAADIFAAFTGNKYTRVLISREFSAMAGSGGSEGLHRALEFSRGTADQLYLAIRFAICKIVPPPGYTLPVILDDAFLSFDEDRLGAALDWLYEEAKSRQILLFTCHKRERLYLQNRADVLIQSI